jgi:integrase
MTNPLHPSTLAEILSFGLWMQKNAYRPTTVLTAVSALKAIAKRTNLMEPEATKTYVSQSGLSEGRKELLVEHLARFYKYKDTPFEKPHYNRVERLPFIPLESEVDQLISAVGYKTSAFLQLIKETGMRPGEAWNIKWLDIDAERSCITVTPEKNSRSRQLKITSRLLAMLQSQNRNSPYVFHKQSADPVQSLENFRRHYEDNRANAAKKLQNPRLLQISFRTLRHWKATTEYHKTKDILHVMQILGHKNIKNTLIYTHLVNFETDAYVCKIANTVEEAKALVEQGFDYVTEVDGMKLFRIRK